MFKTLASAFKNKDIRKGLLITILLLLVYRLGCFLPIPGIDPDVYGYKIDSDDLGVLTLLNSITGSALANGSFLALGVTPYINASIIIQLLQVAFPKLEELAKSGEDGRKKINLYMRIAALVLAIAQAIGITMSIGNSNLFASNFMPAGMEGFTGVFAIVILVSGAMFTVWLGERITQHGIGNGLSLLIFVGILSSAGSALSYSITNILSGNIDALWNLLLFILAVILVFALIVFIDGAERKIPVQYAKQIKGRKTYGGQSNNIPIKVNSSGVMPIIFASAILSFPSMLISIFWPDSMDGFNKILGPETWLYIVLMAVLILFFSYFYAQISFKPEDISKNLQQGGGFISGIRPGKETKEHLSKISKRITLFGALYLAFIALVPAVIFSLVGGDLGTGLTGAFSATGMLIVVSVALEFDKQLEAQLMMKNYRGFLK